MARLESNHNQASQRYKETTTYYQNNLNIILQVIQEVHAPKLISTDPYKIPMIPRYQAWNYKYVTQLHKNAFIRSGRENGTRGHVDLYKKWIQNDSGGVFVAVLENQDSELGG